MKCLKNICKNFVLRSDLFAAAPTLRMHGEPSYETTFGGCLSILLVCAFAAIFSTSFIEVLQKVNVTASLNLEDNPYDTQEISGIRLAVGIQGFDFSETQRYFNIILKLTTLPLGGNETSVQITLAPCALADWQDQGDNFDKLFDVYGFDKMLCPSPDQELVIGGFAGSDSFKTMSVMVQQCKNGTSTEWTCHSPLTIKNKFDTHFMTNDFFKANFIMLNTVISPQQENATKTVLQNQIFLTFSNTSGARSEIKLGRYSIVTDNSIWPFTQEVEQTGYYIADKTTYAIGLYSTHYIRVQIQKSRTIYQVTRSHDKIDEMLSYVGGLFALLFTWIFFFIGSYNEYKYEITIAQHGFALDDTGRKVREDNFGFWTYLKYSLYDWIKTFGIPLSWKRMEDIDMAREQANQQMDVTYLMKRMQKFQMINKFLLGQHNLVLTSLAKPHTLEQVKKLRKITQYYDKVIKIENEENLLKEMIRVSSFGGGNQIVNDNGSEMVKMGTIFDKELEVIEDEDVDLDSEDEQAQVQILEAYSNYSTGEKNNQVSHKIMLEISQQMKERLERIKRRQRRKKLKSNLILEDASSQLNQSMNTNVGFNIMNLIPKQK